MRNEAEFQTAFNDLMGKIRQLPPAERTRLEALAAETQTRHVETRDAIDRAHTALDKLTLTLQMALLRS